MKNVVSIVLSGLVFWGAAAEAVQSDSKWIKYDADWLFEFKAPAGLTKLPRLGFDSQVGEFEGLGLEIGYDTAGLSFGEVSKVFTKKKLEIHGKSCSLRTLLTEEPVGRRGIYRYVADLSCFYKSNSGPNLTVYALSDSREKLELAGEILETVWFPDSSEMVRKPVRLPSFQVECFLNSRAGNVLVEEVRGKTLSKIDPTYGPYASLNLENERYFLRYSTEFNSDEASVTLQDRQTKQYSFFTFQVQLNRRVTQTILLDPNGPNQQLIVGCQVTPVPRD